MITPQRDSVKLRSMFSKQEQHTDFPKRGDNRHTHSSISEQGLVLLILRRGNIKCLHPHQGSLVVFAQIWPNLG